MNIVYHHRTLGRGGEGHHISSIVNAFERSGHKVLTISPPGVDPLTDNVKTPVDKTDTKEKGIHRIWQLISKRFPQSLFEVLEFLYNFRVLWYLFRAVKPSFVYERYAFFLWAGALYTLINRIPFLLEVNEVSGLKRARGQKFVFLTEIIETWVFQRANAIFVVSSKLREEVIRKGIAPEKITITPNAVRLSDFSISDNDNSLRTKFGFQGTIVFGFVGWFDNWDRLDQLIDIFNSLINENENLRLLLVGDGPIKVELEEKIEDYSLANKVVLTGGVDRKNIKYYINAMDITLIPHSNVFGSPIILFEYMAMKKAIIAADLPPIMDVITNDNNGLVFPCGDLSAMMSAMHQLISNKEKRIALGENAYNTLRHHHTWDVNAEKIINQYHKISGVEIL